MLQPQVSVLACFTLPRITVFLQWEFLSPTVLAAQVRQVRPLGKPGLAGEMPAL